ncbi:hypothetical protein D9M68_289100 [compost metagenome]
MQTSSVNGATVDGVSAESDGSTAEKLGELKAKVHSVFGQVVLAMTSVPRYRVNRCLILPIW